ncbi:hypothetical protein TbgDal_X4290 [Trypanosoma brucei gambiense DAL972]|uniref:Uncharacterized protein n=1 Tax=Trypanosoma brucei gambiense (strain MHOM/CI/86/DAL972) TaxID=679716 RepID=D0A251_TRYB9|nr:hypothetical protein TbgDal_X4290 [Trypanosoma brucei gambiense DAL972]CBH15344.1 hypothetical protein TbgDal_X4290 [Trypanosoma brucei gambiense DAL972]|eukprot:XP_011777609.1 hypothetical protein TbgDal_X4290 [Trypanosoma brucei gambiense DAL972]
MRKCIAHHHNHHLFFSLSFLLLYTMVINFLQMPHLMRSLTFTVHAQHLRKKLKKSTCITVPPTKCCIKSNDKKKERKTHLYLPHTTILNVFLQFPYHLTTIIYFFLFVFIRFIFYWVSTVTVFYLRRLSRHFCGHPLLKKKTREWDERKKNGSCLGNTYTKCVEEGEEKDMKGRKQTKKTSTRKKRRKGNGKCVFASH